MKYDNEKDELFYTDLVYEIKRLAGFDITDDEIIIKRIEERKKDKKITTKSKKTVSFSSPFIIRLYRFALLVGELNETRLSCLEDIKNYPETVKELLKEYEEKPKSL